MIGSGQPLASRYDVALLDLDGVVYLAEDPVRGAPEALAAARAAGMRLAFVTNNASRTPDQVAALLRRVGVPAEPAEVITSAQAAAHYLADRLPAGARVLVLGTTGLIEAVTERGLTPVFSADDQPAAVVQGFFPDLELEGAGRGRDRDPATARCGWPPTWMPPCPRRAARCPATVRWSPRCATPPGSCRPPPASRTRRCMPRACSGPRAEHPIVVGDRLDTDIEGARRADCASLLVLTGVTDAGQLLRAGPLHRPDYLGKDVSALLERHPDVLVEPRPDPVRCGGGPARAGHPGAEPGRWTAPAGSSDGLDPLRALVGGRLAAGRPGAAAGRGPGRRSGGGDRAGRTRAD